MEKLKFEYAYTDNRKPDLCVAVVSEGSTRQELVNDLLSKRNPIALYYFWKYYPDLSENIKERVISEFKKIATQKDLQKIKKAQNRKISKIYESVFYVTENNTRVHYF